MKKQNEAYFNFPIQLLEGFLRDSQTQLEYILDYHLYAHSLKLDAGDELKNFIDSAKYWNVELGNEKLAFDNGKMIYESLPVNSPMTGIKESIFWDYFQNFKTDFEKACLLGHLALKSILGSKPFCKTDNLFWFSRMAGKPNRVKFYEDLESPNLAIYTAKPYRIRKIKEALEFDWGLKRPNVHARGFYFSYSMSLKDLEKQAIKKQKGVKRKWLQKKKREAKKQALQELEDESRKQS